MAVICDQHRDGISDGGVLVVPPLAGETDVQTLARKLQGAINHGWTVEASIIGVSFHVSKVYPDGQGTHDRTSRKDRYFSIQ